MSRITLTAISSPEMLLTSDAVCFADVMSQVALQLRSVAEFKAMNVVSRRDGFNLVETGIVLPLGKHEMPAQVASSSH